VLCCSAIEKMFYATSQYNGFRGKCSMNCSTIIRNNEKEKYDKFDYVLTKITLQYSHVKYLRFKMHFSQI